MYALRDGGRQSWREVQVGDLSFKVEKIDRVR